MGAGHSTQTERVRGRWIWVHGPDATVVLSASLVFAAAAVWGICHFGSFRGAMNYYLRGESLSVDSITRSFGVAKPSDRLNVSFNLTNQGDETVRILGCQAYCNCVVPQDLPFALRPGEKSSFTISVHIPSGIQANREGSTHLELPLTLFTSNPQQSRVSLAISGDVRDEPTASHAGS